MPRPGKGARLWLRPEERNSDGSLRKRAVWVIRDGPRKISTGCAAEDREGAERALGEHLANKYQPNRTRGRHPSEILIADVSAIYLTDVAPRHAREEETKQRVLTLDAWWADKTLAEVNGANCRAYVAHRTAQPWKAAKAGEDWNGASHGDGGAARRELEDLRAAINHHRQGGACARRSCRSCCRREPRARTMAYPVRGGAAVMGRLAGQAGHARPGHPAGGGPARRPVHPGRPLHRHAIVGDLRCSADADGWAAGTSTLSRACSIAARSAAGKPKSGSRR